MEKNAKTTPQTRSHVKRRPKMNPKIWMGVAGGSLVLLLFVFAFIHTFVSYLNNKNEMEKLGHELVDLKSAMNIDSVRQYKIQKILSIIERHNSKLTSMEAYDISSEIYDMSVKYANINTDLLCAVITHESALTWNPQIVSKAGAMGLMQIMPVTGYFLAQAEGLDWTSPTEMLCNPIYNIRLGARFLSMLIDQYGLDGGLAAYNGGEKQASIWLANGKDNHYLFTETRDYIPAVVKLYDTYKGVGL